MTDARSLLDAGETVAILLSRHEVPCVIIGAVALAAYRHIRYTEDIDLGVNADLETLRRLTKALEAKGFQVELREPDAQDPLGGVIDVYCPCGMVQIISFADRFPAVIQEAIEKAVLAPRPNSSLRLAPIPYLIALKLYAGGMKSKADISELLLRNPEVDLEEIRTLCARFHLSGLEDILTDLHK